MNIVEQKQRDMEKANYNYDVAFMYAAKTEAALRLYEAYRKGVENLITERATTGKHLQDIINTYLPEMEEITERIIEERVSLPDDMEKLKKAYILSDQASEAYVTACEAEGV